MKYRLSTRADDDLATIYITGAEQFGQARADAYLAGLRAALDMLARSPTIYRERAEIVPPVRVFTYRSHAIVYELAGDEMFVIRIAHGRSNWPSELS